MPHPAMRLTMQSASCAPTSALSRDRLGRVVNEPSELSEGQEPFVHVPKTCPKGCRLMVSEQLRYSGSIRQCPLP